MACHRADAGEIGSRDDADNADSSLPPRLVAMDTIRAWAWGERTKTACRRPAFDIVDDFAAAADQERRPRRGDRYDGLTRFIFRRLMLLGVRFQPRLLGETAEQAG